MVTATWVALILLGAVLYGVLGYLVSIGARTEGMLNPATTPVWRLLLAGVKGEPRKPKGSENTFTARFGE